jgi:hypothetical protein
MSNSLLFDLSLLPATYFTLTNVNTENIVITARDMYGGSVSREVAITLYSAMPYVDRANLSCVDEIEYRYLDDEIEGLY